ncbi:SMI1/KNR4 family protein [Nocardia sp. NBC_01503]|uniref:SMI1/KNR4 family protein n=1 Tax=Nocardia sp. NBC_01503 TaxID=2975997 RepID=UPI002E7B1597|nr:SMI1/KNR4 family protein [Nocardia sp. NBC_01503]WTL33933.1 SMI1/KNR4 family protein [Nocardia sp. NBC_01503]
MTDLAEPLIMRGLVAAEALRGCGEEEIVALMNAQGVTELPLAYREFLGCAGRDPYWLSRNDEWDYDWVVEAKDLAREIVVDDYERDFEPFENSFIFLTHHGYMFYYFRPEDLAAPDPNFWIYLGDKPVRDSGLSFTQWLRGLADYLPTAIELRREVSVIENRQKDDR